MSITGWRGLGAWPLAVALLLGLAVPARAADPFAITYDVDRSSPTRIRIKGSVTNNARADVIDVYVTAEALDASGKVVARGVSFVASSIGQGRTESFTANVPARPGITGFNVLVSSYRFGQAYGQSP